MSIVAKFAISNSMLTDADSPRLMSFLPELDGNAVCSTTVNAVDDPQEIYISWCRRARGRFADLLIRPDEIDVQYGEYDKDGLPHLTTNVQPIHPEALMELHGALTADHRERLQ